MAFDPNAAALPGSGAFGLDCSEDEAAVVLLPVPFDATTSYRRGAAGGPAAILEASRQVDLFDRETGKPYERGIAWRDEPGEIKAWNEEARRLAEPIIAAAGVLGDDQELTRALARVNELSGRMNERVYDLTRDLLARGKLVGVVGGDHSVPFGAIRAIAERHPGVGVLHVDAHADLRDAYEGFTFSHASIMRNVATRIPAVGKLVQVGIRDFSEDEDAFVRASGGRIVSFFDADVARARFEGKTYREVVEGIVATLPAEVYVSFDIDGLDPALCPGTGTPVPGGLSFHEATYLLGALPRMGKRIVGFDVNEVAPGEPFDEWNGNVGARLLYKLLGYALLPIRGPGSGSPSGAPRRSRH